MSIDPVQEVEQLAYELKIVINKFTSEFQSRAKDEYVGNMYRSDFTVTGRGAFPIDMLRYCNAWPKGEEDASQIEHSIEQADGNDPFTIRLTKYHRDPKPQLAEDRWERKFRWKTVGEVETTSL